MRILFTNDDGYCSQGLHAVADLFKRKHDIAVVAPDVQRSGASHSMTLRAPIACKKADGYDYPVYSVCGTPVDCVKIALMRFFPKPDIIVSGINDGRNVGGDIMYSGTVAAASEGAYYGIRSFALSYGAPQPNAAGYKRCAEFFFGNFEELCKCFDTNMLINLNFPSGEFRGVKAARMDTSIAFDDIYNGDDDILNYRGVLRGEFNPSTDEDYVRDGYITVTPLILDRTDYNMLGKLNKREWLL